MSDYAAASALGGIYGTLKGMSLVASADKAFAALDAHRASSQELQIERAAFREAYGKLRAITIDLDNEVQRLNALVGSKDNEIAHRDQIIERLQRSNADAEEYIAGLKRTVTRLANPEE
jgi:predicted RNase H-like nuclease (RuvC/YqgF family)